MYRYGRTRQRRDAGIAAAVLVVLLAAAHAGGAQASSHPAAASGESRAARAAIAYARHQLGCPYVWAGTGPCAAGFDCSGLTMMAYRAAGVDIPRTAAEQWSGLRHVSDPQPGDLVFFAGADGTWTDPGHVAMVLDPDTHTMIEAYATGFSIRISTYGLPSSAPGDGDPIGYAEVR
jgi:cell wall-associated NlpC family hydrolase